MICMSRTEGKDGKIQGFSLIEVREGLKMAATRIGRYVDRGKSKRAIEYGLLMSRLAAWFLVQEDEAQRRIIQQGNAIIDDLCQQDDPHPPLEGEHAKQVRARHPEAGLDRWIHGLTTGPVELIEKPATGAFWDVPDAGPEEMRKPPAQNLGKRLKGEKRPVGVRRRAPKGE